MEPQATFGIAQLFRAMAVRQQSVIANPMEAVRQNVKQKAADAHSWQRST
jgi:hypothetical protein